MSSTSGSENGKRVDAPTSERITPRTHRRAKEPVRRQGVVAEEALLRSRIELARALGDPAEERAAARVLADKLAAREVEIDLAVELAFRSLASRDDAALRHALAGWLEGLGDPGLASSELRKLAASSAGDSASAILVRIGVLHARAGDPIAAQDALVEAAELADADALPLELLGAVAGWATAVHGGEGVDLDVDGFPGPRAGAEAYVRAARRRAAARDPEGEMDNLLRAFELAPSSSLAAAALMSAYKVRGRDHAADQVLRAHAAALGALCDRARSRANAEDAAAAEQAVAAVHARRRATALEAGDVGRALGAALDEGIDGVLEGPGADVFDDLLARVNAYEPLAVRLELRAEREEGRTAALRWLELGRLLSGPLSAPDRAVAAFARAVAADASNAEAVHALRSLAQLRSDTAWLIEALVRAAMGPAARGGAAVDARLAAAHELASLAEERGDARLAAWSYRQIAERDPSDERARASAARLDGVVKRHDEELARARSALASSSSEGRRAALREVVRLARSVPEASRELAAALLELADPSGAEAAREVDGVFDEAIRVAERVGDFEGIVRSARAALGARGSNVRVRGVLVAALRRAGDLAGAASEARAFADESATRWTCSVAWINAAAAGDASTRARSLASAAPACGARVIAEMSAVAAEALAAVGEMDAARRAAEQACRSGGEHARALFVLARASTEARIARGAAERAMDAAVPSASWCMRVAEIAEQLGDARGAIDWARRAVSLRPGDPAAAQALVDHATRAGDAGALADALGWLSPQPRPSKETAERLAPALEALAALDAPRAAALGRRALDLVGPRHAPLRRALERVADAAGSARLRATVAERWIAAGAPAAERGPLLLELAVQYRRLDDLDAELYAYARATREGVSLTPALARFEELARAPKRPDAELAFLEALPELRLDLGDVTGAADAFRALGAALWDMADDRPRAVQAWLRAAHCDSVHGYDTLRRDLTAFADTQYAVDCLSELVEREADRVRSGVIATQAARAALEARSHARALGLAKIALERDPGHADALETAEAACVELARVPEMSPIYDHVARRARGRFGRRAAHHRAARFFDTGGMIMLALKHAAQAFIAVPSEGTTLTLLRRTATKARRESVAVRTLEHVAELARSREARAGWLLRAASMTAEGLDGMRQKADLLLKAAVVVPTPATLAMLAAAAREVVSLEPDDAAAVALRLERASEQLAKSLEGPDGARIAITFVEMAMDPFGDAEWAWRAIEQAIGADADVDEYVRLVPYAAGLSRTPGAGVALARVMAEIDKPYANVGHALLLFVGAIAKELGDAEVRAKVLVRAAEKEPDDDAIVASADEAARAHGDAKLLERLAKKIDGPRRAEALRATARKAVDEGDAEASVRMLERAGELASSEQRAGVAEELRAALVAAGRGEDAIARELARPEMERSERGARWSELARLREERGDLSGAADAFLQAALEDGTAARWGEVERAADASGRERLRVDALEHLVAIVRANGGEVQSILKRLARAEGARGSLGAAETAWREVMELDPNDAEADVALEALLVARGSFEDLAEHLAERAARLAKSVTREDRDKLRAVRLRRAAILEQRLVRFEDACAELEQVLMEEPDHPGALRWLADLYERAGEPQSALPALDRLLSASHEELEYVNIGVRRVRALVASGDLARARAGILDLRARVPSVIAVAEARVEVARATQDPRELGDALADLARFEADEPRVRSEMLVEAAQAAARAGVTDASLERAREAARLAPDVAATQLFARGLEYRLRGVGSRDEALATIAALDRLGGLGDDAATLEPEDVALRAFLLAEAEDAAHGSGSGEATLKRCLARIGAQPLIALGLAERAAKAGRHEEAYRFYTEAVYGNLLGLRRPGRVAMAAAESASRAGDIASTTRFLNEAAKDPETRMEALRRVARVALSNDDIVKARSVLRGLAEGLKGVERAEILAELARALLGSSNPSERLEGDRTMREAIEHAGGESGDALRAELEAFRTRPPRTPVPSGPSLDVHEVPTRRLSVEIPGLPKIPPPPPVLSPTPADGVEAAEPSRSRAASEIPTTPAGKVAKARARLLHGSRQDAERLLTEALREGAVEAADVLDELLRDEPSQRSALVNVRRQAVELQPGSVPRLVALRDAARLDQNANYVRAIEHVLRAGGAGAGPLAPPPLSAQSVQPGILTLLTCHSHEAAGEAFGVVWEGAPAMFTQSAAAAKMSGLERVVPGPTSGLTRVYEAALRLLDTPRFALFQSRSPVHGKREDPASSDAPLSVSVALLSTPAAILSGDTAEDTSHLRWVLGQALSCVLPQNALVLGLDPNEARSLWGVLLGAFGPPGLVAIDRKQAELADMLWQTLAPRTQRRLKELLASSEETPFDLVHERAKQSGRRLGLFLTGDFGHAARTVMAELATALVDLARPGALERACADVPALADLLRLAVRPEYADARWHLPTPASQRLASGKPRPV